MKNEITIITIHTGIKEELIKTLVSIDNQKVKPYKNIVIINKIKNFNFNKYKKKYRKFIIGKDSSLYNAMNIGIKLTKKNNILFLNSGDTLYKKNTIQIINRKLKIFPNTILIFKTVLKYKNLIFFPKNKFFNNKIYSPHPSFIRPKLNSSKVEYYNENNKINSDGEWMRRLKNENPHRKINVISSIYYLGGRSSKPSLKSIFFLLQDSFLSFLKELFKYLLYKINTKKNYYKLIYSKKFKLKIEKK